ncbi:MAG: ribonuclease III [Actinobacteria bacterium]|uniref:ribonuclease III n=1 Tax=freshwater metagenome TaxID=449393 RepID=A0A6J6B3M8_9ZZZZ|nr:ribonuclease III [Actinomycetota bacterium]
MTLGELQARLGVTIEPELLELALTHTSFSYENGNQPSNERLEFLGDSVLGFVVSAHITQTFTDLSEGELSRLKNAVVSAKALAPIAENLRLGDYLRLGVGEERTGGRSKPNLLADSFEAVLGAIYVSAGIEAATEFLRVQLFPLLADPTALLNASEPKTKLQELAAKLGLPNPEYTLTHDGPDHDRTFTASLLIKGRIFVGTARSKRDAETEAALAALSKLA